VTTICANCANLFRKEPADSPRYDVWYNLLCMASPLVETVDIVSGKTGYSQVNDLGKEYVTDEAYEYCRDVNKGTCGKFFPSY